LPKNLNSRVSFPRPVKNIGPRSYKPQPARPLAGLGDPIIHHFQNFSGDGLLGDRRSDEEVAARRVAAAA
jgi:hypothetical protein